MKLLQAPRLILIGLLCCFAVQSNSQSTYNLVIFSEDGMPFTAYVNAIQQNEIPSTNIRVTDLNSPNAVVKVRFADEIAPELQQNVFFQTPNTEVTLRIKETKKGLKLRYFGEVPIEQSVSQSADQVVYRTEPIIIVNEPVISTTTTTTTQTTRTSSGADGNGEHVGVDISMGGVDFNMDVTIDDNIGATQSTTTTSTTTTTTSGGVQIIPEDELYYDCPPVDFSSLRSAVADETFDDDRINVARQGLRDACIYVSELQELAGLIDFEDDRLDFVKYAYDRTIDVESFYQMNAVFTFSSTKEELNEFLEGK